MNGIFIKKAGNQTAFEQMLADDLCDIVGGNSRIECAFRIYDHNRAVGAQAKAAGFDNFHFISQVIRSKLFFKRFDNHLAAGRRTTGTAADKDMGTIHCLFPP